MNYKAIKPKNSTWGYLNYTKTPRRILLLLLITCYLLTCWTMDLWYLLLYFTCLNFRLHDHGLLAIYRQISHNYSESFGKPCAQLLYSSATSSNEPFACIIIIYFITAWAIYTSMSSYCWTITALSLRNSLQKYQEVLIKKLAPQVTQDELCKQLY